MKIQRSRMMNIIKKFSLINKIISMMSRDKMYISQEAVTRLIGFDRNQNTNAKTTKGELYD